MSLTPRQYRAVGKLAQYPKERDIQRSAAELLESHRRRSDKRVELQLQLVSAPPASVAGRYWFSRAALAVAATVAIAIALLGLRKLSARFRSVSAERNAIITRVVAPPFTIRGGNHLSYMRDGMVDLLLRSGRMQILTGMREAELKLQALLDRPSHPIAARALTGDSPE